MIISIVLPILVGAICICRICKIYKENKLKRKNKVEVVIAPIDDADRLGMGHDVIQESIPNNDYNLNSERIHFKSATSPREGMD